MKPFMNGLYKLCHRHLKLKCIPSLWNMTQTRMGSAYEGHGTTTVNVINKDNELGLFINSYSTAGFRLSNEILILGPIILFPRVVFSWNVEDAVDINDESLSMFSVLDPKIDVLVIGVGEKNIRLPMHIMKFLRKCRTNVEILDTPRAVSTYNFLNADRRNVAAALIPPTTVSVNDDDVMRTRRRDGIFINKQGESHF